MPKVKYGADVVKKILTMKHNGYRYSEIATEMKMNAKAVENLCTRYRLLEKKKNPNFPLDIKVEGNVIGTITPMKDNSPKPKIEEPKVEVPKEQKPEKTLNDYTARELIKRLYDMGLRIEGTDWNLYCIVKKTILLNDIIGA